MTSTTRKRARILRNILVPVAVVTAIFAARFHQLGQSEALASVRSIHESEGVPVETVRAENTDLSHWITLAGTVEGRVQYSIVSTNALRVVGIPVSEGERVSRGDVIIRLASGAPSPMYHSVDKSRAGYDNALRDVKRLRNLFDEGAVSRASLDAAETQLKVAEADLQDAEGSTVLTASEDGVVSAILVGLGETVSTHDPLAWITDTEQVKVRFAAGSAQALSLSVGQPARWSVEDNTKLSAEGEVTALDLMANPETHLLDGEALFDNTAGRLVPGLLVSFEVRTHYRENVLAIPMGCLVTEDGADAVWVIENDNATLRAIGLGMENSERVEILSGLQPGDVIVRHGQTLLSDGTLVKQVTGEEN